jgi:hypothetical protein
MQQGSQILTSVDVDAVNYALEWCQRARALGADRASVSFDTNERGIAVVACVHHGGQCELLIGGARHELADAIRDCLAVEPSAVLAVLGAKIHAARRDTIPVPPLGEGPTDLCIA